VPKGVRLKTAECRELFPLSFAYAQQLPRKRWRLFDNSKKGIAPLFGAMPKKDIKSLVTLN
jgi:hypothetical protein